MPSAAPKPCRHAGCGQLVRDGTGYCTAHQDDRKIGKFADERRGSRQDRGYGKDWEVTRKRILSRDKGLCQPCLQVKRYRPARQVDHIINKATALSLGWATAQIEADENLQSICEACHKAKTQAEAVRARRGGINLQSL